MFTHDFEAGEIQSMAREDRGNSIYSLPLNGITDNGKGEGRGLSNSFFSNNHTSDSEGKKKKKSGSDREASEFSPRPCPFTPLLSFVPR